MLLAQLQSCLTQLYGLDLAYRIDDFLITDRNLARGLGGGARDDCDEELLILEEGGEASVSLFLEQALVERLERDNPVMALSDRNLPDFLVALEGVSHFTYFAFKAGRDESVSLLELELQAEVDKFVTTAVLLRRQGGKLPAGLHAALFAAPQLDRALSADQHARYDRANRYAARYCRQLLPSMRADSDGSRVRSELRRFYRLPGEHKISRIESRRASA